MSHFRCQTLLHIDHFTSSRVNRKNSPYSQVSTKAKLATLCSGGPQPVGSAHSTNSSRAPLIAMSASATASPHLQHVAVLPFINCKRSDQHVSVFAHAYLLIGFGIDYKEMPSLPLFYEYNGIVSVKRSDPQTVFHVFPAHFPLPLLY